MSALAAAALPKHFQRGNKAASRADAHHQVLLLCANSSLLLELLSRLLYRPPSHCPIISRVSYGERGRLSFTYSYPFRCMSCLCAHRLEAEAKKGRGSQQESQNTAPCNRVCVERRPKSTNELSSTPATINAVDECAKLTVVFFVVTLLLCLVCDD